jgi:hypothetical protein
MNRQVIKNRFRKILAYTVTGVTFLLISAFLTLQIPAVQESLIDRYLGNFSKVTGFTTTVSDFRLLWFDRLELEDVVIRDPASNQMVRAKSILINFKLAQLLRQQDINIDGIFLDSAYVFVTKIPEYDTATNLNINVFIHQINKNYGGSGTTGRSPRINIGEAILNSSQFSYVDQERDSVRTGFNYNHFTVDIDEGELQNFLILGDTTQFNVRTLIAADHETKFTIKQLSTFFRLSQQSMEFIDLDLKAGNSTISDSIIFTFNGQQELSDFIDKVQIHARLDNTIIQPKDLAHFAPDAERLTQPIKLSGVFIGKIHNFKFTEMEVGMGNTTLRGSVDMEGLPDINETFIILELKNSRIDFTDFAFAINPNAMERLTPMGRVTLSGQFLGYTNDFVAKGDFAGRLGEITSDINFKVNEKNFNLSEYSGALVMRNFDLGQYLKDTINFQKVTLDGKIKGKGLNAQVADFTLNGKVSSIGIKNYNYTNIETNARFAKELFNGYLKINDPNLEFAAVGSVDLRKGHDLVRVQAHLDTAILHNLNLTSKRIFLHSNVDVNIKGLELDSISGAVDLRNFKIDYNNNSLSLANIHLNAERTDQNRTVNLQSTLVDAQLKGNFLLSDISKDINKLVKEIILNIKNDEQAIRKYYETENYRPKSYETDFWVRLKNVDPIVQLVNTDLLVADNTLVEGNFKSGYTTILQVYSSIDSLAYNKSLFVDSDLELTVSKIADSTNVLAMASVNSDHQVINKNFRTRNLVTEAIWNENHIDFGIDADQDGQPNYVRLKGAIDFLRDSTQIRILPSTIKVLNEDWDVDPNNVITLTRKNMMIQDLRIRNSNQFLLVNGTLSPDPSKVLVMEVSEFDLSVIRSIIGRPISGRLDAMFELSNFYKDPFVQNDIKIDSLTLDNFLIGDIRGQNHWDTLENRFQINFFIDRNKNRIVNVYGAYVPSKEQSPLDLRAKLENANLKIIEPFFDDIFSNIGGTITGDYRISGKLEAPAFLGEGEVKDGKIMVNYLKTLYDFTGTVGLSPNSVYFKNIDLVDILRNRAKLNGTITHNNFRETRINVDTEFRNFQVLNTTQRDNSLFYGQGYATGELNIFGPVANLKFTSKARTDKNTRIFIPIGDDADVEKKEFIKFVNFRDSTFQKDIAAKITNKLDLTGITMDFNLDVTPDAYCEIILNAQAGDKIRGRGNGEIQLQLDTKGEFNMFGPFEFTEGWYTFTLYDLINKEFEIKRGSRITWYGDAYGGQLDLSATYNQQASFAPIVLDAEIRSAPQLRRKYPVQVLIKLDGPMLSPLINFDIVATDLPQSIAIENGTPIRLAFEFQAFKNKMDEQELKRQVFSLIVLRRFSPPESFNTTGSDVINSVSELFSNQLSNFVSQVDENLEIDVDFSRMDEEAFNTFQLRLSYTFLNGRLRVTRDGTFYTSNSNNSDPNDTQANLSSLAGDWTVDYMLTADGKLKIKMYNRTNINPILNTIGSQNSVTTGVSISHTQTFNELSDLWKSLKSKNQKQNNNEQTDSKTNKNATKEDDDGGE